MDLKIPINNWQSEDSTGKPFDFFDWQGDDFALIVFFRGKFCGLCRKFLMKLGDEREFFKKHKVKITAVSPDSRLAAAVLKTFLRLDFPNLIDPDFKVSELFGVPKEEKNQAKYLIPSVFLINPKHEIVWAKKGDNYDDFIEMNEMMAKIKENLD
ncbi:MAG TPA: redoxin domain-containing protein [Candidatus Bipolaricaulota bacterium]|nr:redoxin domain-containing protein [Candidatus Bipolaricaulota bacterium]